MLPVDSIRFSQNTVSGPTHANGQEIPLSKLLEYFAEFGYNSEPIEVVRMPDGKFTSLDNRRLWAAYLVGIPDVPVHVREMSDPITDKAKAERFSRSRPVVDRQGAVGPAGTRLFDRGHIPRTYGEAVLIRCGTQRKLRSGQSFPLLGTTELPRYSGESRPPAAEPPGALGPPKDPNPSPRIGNNGAAQPDKTRRTSTATSASTTGAHHRSRSSRPRSTGIQR